MQTKLEKEVRFLKIYALVATLLCAVFLCTAFAMQNQKQKFIEVDVERINIVEKDGALKMVISNKERQHPNAIDGKINVREGGRSAGMIFFNERGDEVGGLTFSGDTGKGQYSQLSFDKFRGDQTIAFQHLENNEGAYFSGLSFNDETATLSQRIAKLEAIKKTAGRSSAQSRVSRNAR